MQALLGLLGIAQAGRCAEKEKKREANWKGGCRQHLRSFLIGTGTADIAMLGERPAPAKLSGSHSDSPVREEEGILFAFSKEGC